jgi:hypothetical protein
VNSAGDLDDWRLVNVLGRPDMHKGDVQKGYWPVGRGDPDNPVVGGSMSPKSMWYSTTGKNLKILGFSDGEIEERYKDWRKDITLPGG